MMVVVMFQHVPGISVALIHNRIWCMLLTLLSLDSMCSVRGCSSHNYVAHCLAVAINEAVIYGNLDRLSTDL